MIDSDAALARRQAAIRGATIPHSHGEAVSRPSKSNPNSDATNLNSSPSRLRSPPPPLSMEGTAADRDARRVDTGHTRAVCSGTIGPLFFFSCRPRLESQH